MVTRDLIGLLRNKRNKEPYPASALLYIYDNSLHTVCLIWIGIPHYLYSTHINTKMICEEIISSLSCAELTATMLGHWGCGYTVDKPIWVVARVFRVVSRWSPQVKRVSMGLFKLSHFWVLFDQNAFWFGFAHKWVSATWIQLTILALCTNIQIYKEVNFSIPFLFYSNIGLP